MRTDPIRRRAWQVLTAGLEGGLLDPVLDRALAETPDSRDRAFLAELVRGTLQWQGRYDHVIACFAQKAPPRDPGLLMILRMALHQMLALDSVPAFAAVHQAVELAKAAGERSRAGFVNGLLQAVSRKVLGEVGGAAPSFAAKEARLRPLFSRLGPEDGPAFLAAWHSHPLWLVERWVRSLGPGAAADLCAFNNLKVPVDLHVLHPATVEEAAAWAESAGLGPTMGVGTAGLRLEHRPPRGRLKELLEGRPGLIVQDATVQEATAWLASALHPGRPGPVLDMCAAPGGKTAHLGAVPGIRNGALIAMEPDARRMGLLTGTLVRTRTEAVRIRGDGLRPPFSPGSFAAVLLDGPCTGTGVLRHHPEARWRLDEMTVARKAGVLIDLADRAADLLAPGGVLMYATCSLEPEENQAVTARLLDRGDLEPLPDARGRWQRLWTPPDAPGDGFFGAVLRRTKAEG
ncbi:MAG: transcription antitermination factor NusB [bacterium]